jgi:hypothetical protein
VRSAVVDMILFEKYEDQDLDADPILVLPCGHFYSMSSLDGIIGIDRAYERQANDEEFSRPLSLINSDVSEKAKQCPDCRAPIHSVRRYSRITTFSGLRCLERKHMMKVDEALKSFSTQEPSKRSIGGLRKIEREIKASPMRLVYEACGGSNHYADVPSPPALPLIRCLQLLGETYASKVDKVDHPHLKKAIDSFEEAILITVLSQSSRTGASVRISLARFLIRWIGNDLELKPKAEEHLTWVINNLPPGIADELVKEATLMKESLSSEARRKAMEEVIAAMNRIPGYDYGGSASSHWFECPNGHPYYIGECGLAMQTSRCPECGEAVGGTNHTLTSTNRNWSGF